VVRRPLAALSLALPLAACSVAGVLGREVARRFPAGEGGVSAVELVSRATGLRRVVREPAAVAGLVRRVGRAREVRGADAVPGGWTAKLVIAGGTRWDAFLYAPERGDLVELSSRPGPTWRLLEEDRVAVNALLP
jgi:hypothetical protein